MLASPGLLKERVPSSESAEAFTVHRWLGCTSWWPMVKIQKLIKIGNCKGCKTGIVEEKILVYLIWEKISNMSKQKGIIIVLFYFNSLGLRKGEETFQAWKWFYFKILVFIKFSMRSLRAKWQSRRWKKKLMLFIYLFVCNGHSNTTWNIHSCL